MSVVLQQALTLFLKNSCMRVISQRLGLFIIFLHNLFVEVEL